VSACPTHGQLLGGYALGALEPREMEEMRRHVADCPYCGPEADRLAALPGLLDRIEPADVPPPTLSPQVEEAVLDRFARERKGEAAAQGAAEPRRASRFARRSSRRSGRPTLPGGRPLAVAAAALVALVVALTLLTDEEGGTTAYASVSLDAMGGASGSAIAQVGEVSAGTGIRLQTLGLPPGSEYEVWCIRSDGRWVSGGTFWADRDGQTDAYLTAAVRPGDYDRMVVTRPSTGGDRGQPVLAGALQD
jgi:anti-sigma-K factor RskA